MSKREFLDQQGYITFAFGEQYLKLAYAQALSIKATQKKNNFAVIVDNSSNAHIEKYSYAFDKVIHINYDAQDWDMSQHWRVFWLTPWKETVMLDADMIFTKSIDHWWDILRLKEVCLTNQIKDFRENTITSRKHRQLFDANLLPDVYAGFMYFRYSEFATEFFSLVKMLFVNWEWIAKEHLIKNENLKIRIDEIFSLATRIIGIQHVTLPGSIPTFVHGKEVLWKLSEQQPWYDQLFTELTDDNFLVGHYKQRLPFHYHHKEWITNDIIEQLERNYKKLTNSSQ